MIKKIKCDKCNEDKFKIEETPSLVWLICSKCGKTFVYTIDKN